MRYEEQLLQNLAAESDQRTTAIDYRWWDALSADQSEARIKDRYTESGTWVKIRFEVCPLCNGKGKHVNPSIDAHGLTRDDFDEDPDFAEDYFSGAYDVTCTLCHAEKVVPVPLDQRIIDMIEEAADEAAMYRAEQLAEMQAGC